MKLQKIVLTPDDLIFFLHIPKTAGTSLYKSLEQKFPLESVLKVDDRDLPYYFNNLRLSDMAHIQFCRQHASYHYRWNFPKKPKIITMLRNPVNRAYSFYKHVCSIKHHKLYNQLAANSFDPNYFFKELARDQITNLQTRMIVGYLNQQGSLSPEDLLSIAKIRLNQFTFFGLQERYSDSMLLLKHIFGWKFLDTRKINVSSKKTQTINGEIIEYINEVNQLDNKLYLYAAKIFDSIINEFKHKLETEH